MPRWLSLWLGVTLFTFWAVVVLVGVPVLLAQLTNKGERPFDRDERTALQAEYPGGTFPSDSTYKWCDGAKFIYFDSRGDLWHHAETCYRLK